MFPKKELYCKERIVGKKLYTIEYFERKKTFRRVTVKETRRALKRVIEDLKEKGHIVTKVEEKS